MIDSTILYSSTEWWMSKTQKKTAKETAREMRVTVKLTYETVQLNTL